MLPFHVSVKETQHRETEKDFVEHLFAAMFAEDVRLPGALELYDRCTDEALQALSTSLSADRAVEAQPKK